MPQNIAGNKQTENKKIKIILAIILLVDLLLLIGIFAWPHGSHLTFALLQPKGSIAAQEKNVILTAVGLMLVIVIPVLTAVVVVARKYRANAPEQPGKAAQYDPDWEGSRKLQFLWWAFPCLIIIGLGILTWKSSHALDPYRPIDSSVRPITIEVVSLNWKWLFIYPEQQIATVNFVEFPQNTPVNFQLTSDAPMNSFWIPQLGGQMYAMAGMSTQLHLMATQTGEFNGSAAEINGAGFAGMKFTAKASSQSDFEQWAATVKKNSGSLDLLKYEQLAQPSENNPPAYYALADQNLYNDVIAKYMSPTGDMSGMSGMNTNGMPQ